MRSDFLGRTARPLLASFFFAAMLGPAAPGASAQQDAPQPNTQSQEQTTQTPAPAQQPAPAAAEPLYTEFKGVKIGTAREEARKKLGSPQEKDKSQDFFAISDRQRARLYYDEKGAVSAVIVTHVGKSADIPTPKAIPGATIEAKQDVSRCQIVSDPKPADWVTDGRTTGDGPLTMIAMQKRATSQ